MDKTSTPIETLEIDVWNGLACATGEKVTAFKGEYKEDPWKCFMDTSGLHVRDPLMWLNIWGGLTTTKPEELPDDKVAVFMFAQYGYEALSALVMEYNAKSGSGYQIKWEVSEKRQSTGDKSFMALILPKETNLIVESFDHSK